MTTRHLYLDIDGVLNTRPGHEESTPWGRHEHPSALISYAPELIRCVNELIASIEELQVFWLTSWEDEAAEFGRQVGLKGADEWTWLPASGPGRGLEWEKLSSLRRHMLDTHPDQVAWCDDELATEPVARAWADTDGVLTVAPTAVLTPAQLRAIARHFSD